MDVCPAPHEKLLNSDFREKEPRKWRSWQFTVMLGAVTAFVIFAANAGVLVWTRKNFQNVAGVATIFQGDCDVSNNAATIFHLAVNILSPLLLSASNVCAQLLSASTRKNIAKAHVKGRWFDIGVPSVRNLYRIPLWRTLGWTILFASSIPLHLVYNSVIFTTFSARSYQAAYVSSNFSTTTDRWNATIPGRTQRQLGTLVDLQHNFDQLRNLTVRECVSAYTGSTNAANWGNLLIIASNVGNLPPVLAMKGFESTDGPGWARDIRCGMGQNLTVQKNTTGCVILNDGKDKIMGIGSFAHIDYCLAESLEAKCTVRISMVVLAIVTLCNLLKVIVMLITVTSGFAPLANVGDAISSFLDEPDITMEAQGPLTIFDVRNREWQDRVAADFALDVIHFAFRNLVGRGLLVCGIAAWGGGVQAKSLGNPTDAYTADTLIRTTLDASIFSNILLVNTPQVLISFVYLFYNNAVTGMLLAREYGNYASTRKPFRTTRPVGQQRTTYWLQMPHRYVLPLTAGMALLHRLVSRSIFLVQIETYDASGSSEDTLVDTINACDYSVIFAIPALVLGFALIVSLGCLSYRKVDPGMPVAGPCSLAISAACANVMEVYAARGPVQYGVLTNRKPDADGRQ
ncbi:unnamed protein product [Zymoseptoria tritici ST99CH_1A5]|uniref:DUF6536 domain-containing protein n=1 Tax=Zymoseptoria tritici ST99CH_1A5 TaxID=1276529 RepID=A0A1Y6LMM8_ZYMTR|nr:unnamed protein product [Zymoseptoria tritici ST99CH_1A5]